MKTSLSPIAIGVTVLGLLGVIATWFSDVQRFGANWMLWSIGLLSVALGALFIVVLEHLTRAQWSIVLRRVPERIAGILPALVILFAIGAWIGISQGVFGWATDGFQELLHSDPHMHGKAVWYSTPFFIGRMVVLFLVWLAAWRIFSGGSIKQDTTKDPRFSLFAKRFAAPFMWLFAISVTVVAVDWLMGMSPKWYSTIFGVYAFSGVFLSGLAATTLGILALKRQGRLTEVRGDHLYSLGGFMFAFTVFWAYIAFSQFLLIWYANLPEETFWFNLRLEGGWRYITYLLTVLRFLLPFALLLSREVKMNAGRLASVAILILAGQALDLYWIIFPELGQGVMLGWQELAFALFFSGLGVLLVQLNMNKGQDLPVGDPNLEAGLNYHL